MVALGTATHVACPAATDKSLPRQFSFSRRRSRVQILVAITIAVTASSVFVFRVKLDTEEEVVTSQEGLLERQAQVDFQVGDVLGNHELQGLASSSSSVGEDIALDDSESHPDILPLPQGVQMLGEDSGKQESEELSSPRPENDPPDAANPAVPTQTQPDNISSSRPSPAFEPAQEEELKPSSHRPQPQTAQQVEKKPTKTVPARSPGSAGAVPLQLPMNACEEGEEKRLLDVEPTITSIQPTYGYLYAKHNVIQIRGRNFGRCETGPYRVIGLVNGVPCIETKWQSEYSALCIAPKISGTRLPVTLQRCSCGDGDLRSHEFNSSQALLYPQQQQNSSFQYSFIEYAARNALRQADDLIIGSRLPFWLDKSHYTKHGESLSQASNMTRFMIPVWLLDAMPMLRSSSSPPTDSLAPENGFKSCAIVGHSASLSGAKLGKEIDSYSAVFRYDGGPSTPKYASDVGNRTTFQVLSSIWAEVLLGEFEDGLHVSRWWSDTATVVFWSERSYQQYVKLRKYYPNAPLRFLSPEFVAHFKVIAEALRVSVQHETQAILSWNPAMLSSLWFSIGLALQVCQQIDLFGVHSRWTHYKYYHEEPLSTSEERIAEFERQLVTALHNNGFLSLKDDSKWIQDQEKMAQAAASKGTVYSGPKCLSRDCNRRSCSGNGVFDEEKKECSCFQIYQGKDCEFNRLYQHKDSLLRVEEMQFQEPKLLSQSVFKHQDKESGDMLLYLQGLGGGSSIDFSSSSSFSSLSPSAAAAATEDEAVNVYRMENSTFAKFPASDVPKIYKRCAVVGNSGSLLFHPSSGAHIDSADAVFRFNQAPTKGFTSYVGSRTTIESLNAAWVKTLLESDEDGENTWLWRTADTDLMLFEMIDPIGLNHRTSSQVLARERWWKRSYYKLRHYFPQRRIRVLNPQFVTWAYALYSTLQERFASLALGSFAGEKPMSGFYVVLYALLTCEQTDLYGFAPYRDEDKFNPLSPRYHYFDSAVPRTGSHSFDLTRYIFQLFEMHLNLTIHD